MPDLLILCRLLTFSLFVTVLLLVPGVHCADPVYTPQTVSDVSGNSADNTASITWASLPTGAPFIAGSPERVSEGLKAYYDFVHNFIDSVFMKGFPDEIIEKGLGGDFGTIVDNYQSYVNYFIGFAICVVIGVLFLLIFPIVACCFCCCRLCGNCGGKKQQLQKNADSTCRKYTFVCILFISTVFIFVGTICIYENNENMTTTLNDIPETAEDNINDIRTFVNNTVNEAQHIVSNNFQFVQTALFRDLDNIGYLVGLPLKTDIEDKTNITNVLSSAYSLADSLDSADAALSSVEANKTAMETSITDLQTALAEVTNNLDAAFNVCASCPTAVRPDYSGASPDIDTSAFPDISGARTSMDNAKGTNLTEQIVNAQNQVEDIPDRVVRDSNSTVVDLKNTISDLSDDLKDVETEITDINNQISGENATLDLDKLILDIKDYKEMLEQYDKYRWYGGVGLASICLLVVVFAVLGLVFGIFGTSISTPPTRRGCVSNCGGIMLMVSASLILIFSALIMLLTFLTFIPGAPIHKVFCEPVTDLDELERYLTIYNDEKVGKGRYFFADMVLNNDTIPLTLTGALRDCKAGDGVFTAFKLDNKLDITDMLNYSKTLDVQDEVDKVNVNLSSVEIYSTSLQTQLTDLKDAVNISFSEFYTELGSNITSVNLSSLAQDLDDYAAVLNDTTAQAAIQAEATKLRSIEAEEYAYVESNKTALNTSVAEMDAVVSSIPKLVDDLDTGLRVADNYIKNNASVVVRSILNTYVNRLLSIIDSYVDFTDDAVKTKLGSCEPVWNIYNSLLVYTFCYNFMDCFNGFWFSLGWVIFFFMPSVIFSVKLAKYFRKMEYADDDSLLLADSPQPYSTDGEKMPTDGEKMHFRLESPPSKAQFWMKNNKVSHRDAMDDCGSSSSPVPPFPSTESNTAFLTQAPPNLYDDCNQTVHDKPNSQSPVIAITDECNTDSKQPTGTPIADSNESKDSIPQTENAAKENNATFDLDMEHTTPILDQTESANMKEDTDMSILDSVLSVTDKQNEKQAENMEDDLTGKILSPAPSEDVRSDHVTSSNQPSETDTKTDRDEDKVETGGQSEQEPSNDDIKESKTNESQSIDSDNKEGCQEDTFEIAIVNEETNQVGKAMRDELTPVD